MKAVPFAAREARRLQAWKRHQLGWSQRAIAELLEVSAAAVSQWFKRVHGFKRRRIRYERTAFLHEAFLSLACCLICYRHL